MVMYVWLCMYGYASVAMYALLCMNGCMAMYVWLCMYGYVCMIMYAWLCMYVCMYAFFFFAHLGEFFYQACKKKE